MATSVPILVPTLMPTLIATSDLGFDAARAHRDNRHKSHKTPTRVAFFTRKNSHSCAANRRKTRTHPIFKRHLQYRTGALLVKTKHLAQQLQNATISIQLAGVKESFKSTHRRSIDTFCIVTFRIENNPLQAVIHPRVRCLAPSFTHLGHPSNVP